MEAAFIRGIYSRVLLTRSNFTNARANVGAMMKISDESTLIIKSSKFEDSVSGNGAIHVELNAKMTLIDTVI